MRKNLLKVLVVLVVLISFSSVAFCATDDPEILYVGKTKNGKPVKQSSTIYSKTTEDEIQKLKEDVFPVALGHDTTRVTYLGQKVPFTHVIETPSSFVVDNKLNMGIAYMDERTNAPVTAKGGFYVMQILNQLTGEIEWQKYCVDNSGYILFGWIVESDGTKYYLSEDKATLGQVITGTRTFCDDIICNFDAEGVLQEAFEEKIEALDINIDQKIGSYNLEQDGPRAN